MANTFKVSTINSVPTTSDANTSIIYTTPPATTTVVLALLLSNKHTAEINTSAQVVSSTSNTGSNNNIGPNATAYIIKDVPIEKKNTLEILSGQKYILQSGDSGKVYAENSNIDVIFSYMEMT